MISSILATTEIKASIAHSSTLETNQLVLGCISKMTKSPQLSLAVAPLGNLAYMTT